MKPVFAAALVAATFGATAAMAAPASYEFDPSHSQVVFDYNHMGFSISTAIVNGVTGKVVLDPEAPQNSSVEATVPLSNLHSISPDMDKHLFSADFFGTDQATAVATFKSTKVELDGDKEAKVTGDLTLNGVTKPVVLEVELNQLGNHPMSGKEVAGFEAETTIKRTDFNLGKFAPAVSDELDIKIAVEAAKVE